MANLHVSTQLDNVFPEEIIDYSYYTWVVTVITRFSLAYRNIFINGIVISLSFQIKLSKRSENIQHGRSPERRHMTQTDS